MNVTWFAVFSFLKFSSDISNQWPSQISYKPRQQSKITSKLLFKQTAVYFIIVLFSQVAVLAVLLIHDDDDDDDDGGGGGDGDGDD